MTHTVLEVTHHTIGQF